MEDTRVALHGVQSFASPIYDLF